MIPNILTKIFGSRNERLLKQYAQVVEEINALEPALAALSDEDLRAKTQSQGARRRRRNLDAICPRRSRSCARRHAHVADSPLRRTDHRGHAALHFGNIAEMSTGEGETLVATLPAYLNALDGPRRARRHRQRLPGASTRADWMGRSLRFLGPERRRASLADGHDPAERRRAVRCRHHLRHQQ